MADRVIERWFAEPQPFLRARWVFLRALGAIFFSAFYSLYFQIHALIGSNGILPVQPYLKSAREIAGIKAYWLIPSLLWLSAGDWMLSTIVWIGLVASVAIVLDLWPRVSIAVAGICFLSFVTAAQEFSSYQSDGMLLEAALLSLFFAPPGLRPGLGISHPPSKATLFMLQWEWFRIYFESGLVKILSGEPQWRNLTAMDKYYENGPLPTWIAWHVQQWPHTFHAATALVTLLVELLVVWLLFLPKKSRLICFLIVTPLQIGIILSANYAFLNYLVLALGILLLNDPPTTGNRQPITVNRLALAVLPILFITSIVEFLLPSVPILNWPMRALEPFRVINTYGLFAIMTRARYEIEFQGTTDQAHWTPYPFRYKPQDVREAAGIYAPYQPRFDWNLWFASLGSVQQNRWVMNVQVRLLENSPEVLRLFRANPFNSRPPTAVSAVVWQYWFTSREERKRTGAWWNRRFVGQYAPIAFRLNDGSIEFR